MEQILTPHQQAFLSFISSKKLSSFYFTGGTALSHFYLQHRLSEDLDFFSEYEFAVSDITTLIGEAKRRIKFSTFDFQQSFNRNIYQLHFGNNSFLKVEFTYYPFTQIEKPRKYKGLLVDSLLDIAVNKVFTLTQNPRGRDYYDLFVIIRQSKWEISDLLAKARIKFDWHIDYLQVGSQFMKVKTLLDDPILINTSISVKDVVLFFETASKKFGKLIFKK